MPQTKPDQTERIVTHITRAIAQRQLKPGTKLGEQKLADIFQVSRTIVRQALNQLSRDHLVTLAPSRGAFVSSPSIEEARDVFAVRTTLEAKVIEDLCRNITPEHIVTLRNHLKAERQAVADADVPTRTRLLGEFHVLLGKMTGNQVLLDILTDLLNRSSLIALMYQSTPSAEHSQAEHEQLVDALEQQNALEAKRLMSQHLKQLERNLKIEPAGRDLLQCLRPTAEDATAAQGV